MAVFVRSYALAGRDSKIDIEEESTGLLQDLGLLTVSKNDGVRYHIENLERPELPWQVVLRVILENEAYGETISFTDLEVAPDSPGLVFALNEKGLFYKIEEMIAEFPTAIVYSSTAGNRVLTIFDLLRNCFWSSRRVLRPAFFNGDEHAVRRIEADNTWHITGALGIYAPASIGHVVDAVGVLPPNGVVMVVDIG